MRLLLLALAAIAIAAPAPAQTQLQANAERILRENAITGVDVRSLSTHQLSRIVMIGHLKGGNGNKRGELRAIVEDRNIVRDAIGGLFD